MADLDVLVAALSSFRPRLWSTDEATRGAILALAALVILFGPLPLALLGSAVFVALAMRDRLAPLLLIILTLPFSPLARPIGAYAFSPTEILTVLATFGACLDIAYRVLARRSTGPDELTVRARSGGLSLSQKLGSLTGLVRGDSVISSLVVLVVAFGAVSLTASVAKHESLQAFRVVILEPSLFFFLAMRTEREQRTPLYLVLALVLAGVLIAMVGFWQYATDQRIITAEADLRRIRGFYGSPNNLGLFLGRAIPFSFALALWWRRGRAPLVAATFLMAVALILTFSIGAWVAVAISLGLVAVLKGRQTAVVAGLVGFGALLVIAGAAVSVPRIGSHFDLQSSTSAIRLDVWTSGAHWFSTIPCAGSASTTSCTTISTAIVFPAPGKILTCPILTIFCWTSG